MALSPADVKGRTSVEEIKAMTDTEVTELIRRAETFIRAITKRTFASETDPAIIADYETMTVMAAEYLYFHGLADVKEDAFLNVKSENIGSYSYTVEANAAISSGKTGSPEFDALISLYTVKRGGVGMLFSISGPSSRKRGPFI